MPKNKTSAFRRCCPAVCLFVAIAVPSLIDHLAESRHLNGDVSRDSNETRTAVLEDDPDLESVVEDYYDDLWQYLEKAVAAEEESEAKKLRNKEPGKGKVHKWNFPDYDYMSDMAVSASDRSPDDDKFKPPFKVETESVKLENSTFAKELVLNKSQEDVQLTDVIRANRESNSEEEFAQRSKEIRLKSIISQVLSFRGGSPKANETSSIPDLKHYNALREIYERNLQRIKTDDWTTSYTEKIQSFYPSCDLPKNTDEDLWSDAYSMNLLFDLEYPSPQEDSTIMIVSAKLRLYKLPQENYISNSEATMPRARPEKNQNSLGILPGEDDRQIRVSVYWYTRSLRRHRAKKKLLDSQMLTMLRPKWAEFNIRAAVRTWKDSGKNFGLVVTVEDEDGIHLPAEQFIQSMNCSKWIATVRPIPSIILDKANQYYLDNAEKQNETVVQEKLDDKKRRIYPYEPLPYPIIDLRTREVPNSEVKNLALVNSAKIALESKLLNFTRNGLISNNNSNNGSGISIFLKNYNNGVFFDPSSNAKFNKSSKGKQSDSKISYFQNVPIGSPSHAKQNRNMWPSGPAKNLENFTEDANGHQGRLSDFVIVGRPGGEESGGDKGDEERETPKIRHSRRHWEMLQKSNSNLRLRSDHSSTEYHK